jgi:hypothetical protein
VAERTGAFLTSAKVSSIFSRSRSATICGSSLEQRTPALAISRFRFLMDSMIPPGRGGPLWGDKKNEKQLKFAKIS